jgi:hypothetical protein
MSDIVKDIGEKHSDSDTGHDCSYNCTTKTKQDKRLPLKWTLTLNFKNLEKFSSPIGSAYNLPV